MRHRFPPKKDSRSMERNLPSAALGALCGVLVSWAVSSIAVADEWVTPPKDSHYSAVPGLMHQTFDSVSMGRRVGYCVVLPPGYKTSDQRYPVVYFLHGGGGNETSSLFIAQAWQQAYRDKKAHDVILVFPAAFRSGYMDHRDGKIMVESMIIRELIPLIDRRFRTVAHRDGRAVHGFSMGSSGALKFVIKYPDMFCSAVAYGGGAIDLEKSKSQFILDILERNLGSDPKLIQENNTYHHLRRNTALVRRYGVAVRMVCGDRDSWLGSAESFKQVLEDAKIPCELRVVPDVSHNMRALAAAEGLASAEYQHRVFLAGRGHSGTAVVTRLTSGTRASLRGIAVRPSNGDKDPAEVWVGGSGATVARSTDAGVSWQNIKVPLDVKHDIRDIQLFADGSILLMAAGGGTLSKVLRSTDAGISWQVVLQNAEADGFFDGFAFSSDEKWGVLYGDPLGGRMDLYRSIDRGATWIRLPESSRPLVDDGEYGFAASGTGIAVRGDRVWVASGGRQARVFRSDDRGQNWTSFSTPLRSGNESSGIFSIAFRNQQNGWIIGGDYANPERDRNNVAISADGGATWEMPDVAMPHKACVNWLNNDMVVAVGRTGVVYSTDGGREWQTVTTEGYYTLAVDRSRRTAYMAGSDGRVARLFLP